jgi:SNF2 family DNA or RNA helicase
LIVAPKGVHRQWIESQIPQHCGIATRCQFWPFSAAKNLDPSPESMAVFSINIDGIKTGKGHDAVDEFISMHKGRILMVMDESHLIKNVSSQRWKAADKFGKRVAYRLIMTGTPIAKDLSDEWSQLKWLDESIIGIRYLASFRNEYCIMGGYEGREVLSHKNVDRFKQKVEKFTFRATKEEIGILPKSYDHWNFDLSKPQKDMIKSLKKDLQAQIESGQITTASNAALKLMRIQQVSNGFVVDEDENIHSIFKDPKENPRIAALIEFLSSKEGKIIIWCRFIQDILMVKEVLGEQAVFYYGAVSDNDRQKAVKDFLSETGPRFFVANPATGGTGLNLQGSCQSVVYFSNSENSIERWQSEDRTHRIGTVGSVVYTDLIAKGSMDLKILSNLRRKKGISDMALGDIQFWLQQDWDKEEALSEINSGNF